MSNYIEYLYVHTPFCLSKCPYCDFFSISTASEKTKAHYTTSLIKELEHHSKALSRPVKSIYIGGGSPLMLGIHNLSALLYELKNYCSKRTEITIEVNPEHLENIDLKNRSINMFKEFGVNRLSIGVQTTDTKIASLISRKYKIKKLLELMAILKKEKIKISVDLMFGLPTQKISLLKKDLAFIKKTMPDHVSMYLFTVQDNYLLKDLLPNDSTIEKMFSFTHDGLIGMGFKHYEVSNYSTSGNESRHNMAYWKRDSYLGFGAGAHSFNKQKGIRSWHSKDVEAYINDPIHTDCETIDKQMEYTETIMLGLRMLEQGVPIPFFKDRKVKELIKHGFLVNRKNNVVVPTRSIPIMDSIIKELTY